MKKVVSPVCAALCLGVGIASSAAPSSSPTHPHSPQAHLAPIPASKVGRDDLVREAVFRYQLRHYGPQWPKARLYFLNIGDMEKPHDPDAALMGQFRREARQVKRVSQMNARSFTVRDRKTAAQGLLLTASGVKWITDRQAEVEGGFRAHGRAGNRATFRVRLEGNRWEVAEETITRQYRADTGGLSRDAHLSMLRPSGL